MEAGKPVALDVSMEAGVVQLTGMLDATTPVPDGAQWQLQKPDGDMITAEYGKTTAFLANAGSYKIMLTVGEARLTQDVAVTAGKIDDITMTLGAGAIEATAVFAAGGPAVPEGATFELQKAEANIDGKHDYVATSYASPAYFDVPAGKYRLVVSRDFATGSAEVEVKAGAVSKAEVNLDGGYLAITAPAGSTIEVFDAEKDISGNRKWIGVEYDGQINKAFEAGAYHAVASKDGAVLGEKGFEVKAGKRTEGTLP
jgi:Ca-activated chloride channel family protein